MAEVEAAPQVDPEEQARALWYAIVSRLFYAPPDRALLEGLVAIGGDAGETAASRFLEAWRELQLACRGADAEAVREEFDSLFVSVGKAPVTPYTAAYAAGHAPDRHLLELRGRLGELGLGRRERVFETEDHASALCDTMRWLIEHGRSIEDQHAFFSEFVEPGIPPFCDAINASALANFYRTAAAFAHAFLEVEKEAFAMHTPT